MSVTSSPAKGTHYVAGEAGTTRLTIPEPQSGNTATAKMKIDVGGTERQAASTRRTLAHQRLAGHRQPRVPLHHQPRHAHRGGPARRHRPGERRAHRRRPTLGSVSVPAKTFFRNSPIAEFQVLAATGGNGAITYTVSGLPAGLVFDTDGTGSCPGTEPHEICGTPTAATSGAQTITATDADSNTAASDKPPSREPS